MNKNRPKVSTYSMMDPIFGKVINTENLCKGDLIKVNENLSSLLVNNNNIINSLFHLINNNVDIFETESPFYTDICYNFDSPFTKDIALKDRIMMIYPNITLCESGCEYKGVDPQKMEAICQCKFKNLINSDFLGEGNLITSQFSEFENILSETNLNVLRCYRRVFTNKHIGNYIGAFIIICLMIIQIILTIIFFGKDLYLIRKFLFSLCNKFFSYLSDLKKNNFSISPRNSQIYTNSLFSYTPKKEKHLKLKNENKRNNINTEGSKFKSKMTTKIIYFKKDNYTSLKKNRININNDNNVNIELNKNNNNQIKFTLSNITSKNESPPSNLIFSERNKIENKFHMAFNEDLDIDIKEYLSTEIDDMDYDEVIKRDKRTFMEYFFDKLKSNQIIFNTILENEPLKPKTMKIILFILNIVLYFFINGLFFNEDYISIIFNSNEKENFFTFINRAIQRIIYTTLVGAIVNHMIECFFVDEKIIKRILKREKDNFFNVQSEIAKLAKNIRKRYNSFIIISFVINIFVLYYICCFNIIYSHSRIEWIETSILILIIMEILSILISLLETIIRFIGIKAESEKIYKISLYLA